MKDYIMTCFIIQNKNTLMDIYNYVRSRYDKTIELTKIKETLSILIKNDIIFYNNIYELTNEGNVVLNDLKFYYSKIIINFIVKINNKINNKINKKYQFKEIRQEQQQLRNYLINNKEQICVICDKKLPFCLLETAHLKPRCILNKKELNDINVVEFMCKYCHTLYDNGYLSIHNGLLQVSEMINNYDLNYNIKKIKCYNTINQMYFIFHYKFIFKKSFNNS